MRRGMALVLSLCVALCPVLSLADSFRMAGYEEDSSNRNWSDMLFFQRMEEQTGISFEITQVKKYEDWKNGLYGMLKGENPPEVLLKPALTPTEAWAWEKEGLLLDLKPYLAESMPNLSKLLAERPDWEAAITMPDGTIPALPGINELQTNNAMWINRTWLNTLNLEMPTTAEELTEVLRAFKKQDPNQNGSADEIPLCFLSLWDLKFLGHAYGLVSNDYGIRAQDGQAEYLPVTDEYRDFLEWLHQLWQEGLLWADGFQSSDTNRQITDTNATMTYGILFAPSPLTLLPVSAMGQYEMMMPMIFDGKQEYRDLTGDVVYGTFALTGTCHDPEAMLGWVDTLYSEEGGMMAQAGLENEEYEWNPDGTWTWLDSAETVASSVLPQVSLASGSDAPGYTARSFQLLFDDDDTHRAVVQQEELKKYSVLPSPMIHPTQEQNQRLAELWAELGPWAEQQMVWFVTGEFPLNDTSWDAFVAGSKERGCEELVQLWQQMLP